MSKLLRWMFQIVIIVLAVVLALAVVVLLCYVVYRLYWQNPPRIENLDERLPVLFHFGRLWVIWLWIIGLQAGALGLGYWVFRLIKRRRASASLPDSTGVIGRSSELDDAWKEIEIRSGRGFLDRVYLTMTPSEELADALLDASGLNIESRIPRAPAFLRASRAAGATFLTCVARPPQADAGAGTAPSSVEYVCERIKAAGSPPGGLQGVIVMLPVDWLDRTDAPRLATVYRGDLQSIARVLDLRPPVYAVVTSMESQPGFLEFARRMTESFRTKRRCGFYLPGEPADVPGLINGGLVWFSGWYQTWMLYLMANEPLDHRGNNALFALGSQIRRFRRRLPELIGTAIAAPEGGENIPLCGCYFAATGPSPDAAACVAGIIRGRLLDNAAATRWASRAIDQDLAYRRAALTVGTIGGAAALAVWAYIVLGIGSLHWLGLALPAALVAGWVVTLLRLH